MDSFTHHYTTWFKRHFSSPPHALAVGISGGADSVALLLGLHDYATSQNIPLTAITVDHGLRPESGGEAEWVAQLCARHRIPHVTLTWEKKSLPKAGLQAKAREARLSLMAGYCRTHNIHHLALAHHMDDLAETVAMRLFRGAGVDGLSGIPPVTPSKDMLLLHPLLAFKKAELMAFLQAHGQDWCEDASNRNPAYARNRIRKAFEMAHISPEPIATAARNMARVGDFLRQETQKAVQACLTFHELGYITLHRPSYNALHPEIQLRLLRHVFTEMNGDAGPRMDELEHLHQYLIHKHTLAKTAVLCKEDTIIFYREPRYLPPPQPFSAGMWDYRFAISGEEQGFTLAPLGKRGVKILKEHKHTLPPVPDREILHGLPALWHLENLVSVPHITWQNAAVSSPLWESAAFPKAMLDPYPPLLYI